MVDYKLPGSYYDTCHSRSTTTLHHPGTFGLPALALITTLASREVDVQLATKESSNLSRLTCS